MKNNYQPDAEIPRLERPKFRQSCLLVSLALLYWLLHRYDPSYAVCSRNGRDIYTVDQANTRSECFVVYKAHITDIGSLEHVRTRWKSRCKLGFIRKLRVKYIPEGSIVVPGISDSHVHLFEYGALKVLPLDSAKTIEETVAAVKTYILANPDVANNRSTIIEGFGWDQTVWPTTGWPSSDEFEADPITKERRIILQSKDGHAFWVSKLVLADNSPYPDDVPGGVIVRDASGNPTGVFLDDAAKLIQRAELTEQERQRRFNVAVNDALANGLTSVHDAGFNPESLEFFQREAARRQLPIRLYGMSFFDPDTTYWGNTTRKITPHEENRLTMRSVKMYADGSLRAGGAALYEPYTNDPSTSGFMRLSDHILYQVIPQFLKDGWQVNIHAIGDRANGLILDAFQISEELHGVNLKPLRPRIEHAQIITPQDSERLGKLGIIASVQPTHAIDDMWYAEDRLGPERIRNLYPFRTILNSTARMTLGSDFPVESINPLAGFYAAITRLSEDGRSPRGPGGYFPEQALTRLEALRGMTIEPAYASFSEPWLGSIEVGKRADYVVLTQNIMEIPAADILKTKVVATVLDGRIAYGTL